MNNSSDMYDIGIKLIESAIMIDESLAELLKEQIKLIKKSLKDDAGMDEIQKYNHLLRNIIFTLTLTDEKIKTGIDLCLIDKE